MLLEEAFDEWLVDLPLDVSKNTVRSYRPCVRRFLDWLTRRKLAPAIDDMTLRALKQYRGSISHLRPRTICARFAAIKSFGGWLVANTHATENHAAAVPMPKKDQAQRPRVIEADVAALLKATYHLPPKGAEQIRALIYVLCTTGIRRQEVLDLRTRDIDLTDNRLTVQHGKGDKRRVLFMADDCALAVATWLDVRKGGGYRHSWLWCVDTRRRMGEVSLYRVLDNVCAVAGLRGRIIRPHSLRHAFATRLVRNGADLPNISAALGHSDLRTTAVYIHSDESSLKLIANLSTIPVQADAAPDLDVRREVKTEAHPRPKAFRPPRRKTTVATVESLPSHRGPRRSADTQETPLRISPPPVTPRLIYPA